MKNVSPEEVARLIDISAVQADSCVKEIEDILLSARKYKFICVFVMPGMLPRVTERLKDLPDVMTGGIVGFPSGGETTAAKVFQANELKTLGCNEIDMVLNIGKLKSGLYNEVKEDILRVKDTVSPLPLKVIMEVALLTDEEIIKASTIIKECDAAFIKTGTGWAGPTSLHHIRLIKDTVGNTIQLKVAGGVRSLDTLLEMHEMGVSRFGIGYKSAVKIMEECISKIKE